jgi:type I restriction enzyme S subunit
MSYLLNTRQSVHSLRGIAAGTTSVAAIYERDLARIVVPLPPKAEQVAIAEALSGTQALVSSLERLIAKKRLLKQGVAHQLLTGKTRLPGFTREWTLVSIDDVADRAAGVWGAGEPSPRNPRPADIIRAGDISQDSRLAGSARRYLTRQEFAKAECRLDDVVITTSGNGLGKVWWCDGREDLAASNFVRLLHPRPGRSQGRYLAYVLRSEEGLRQLQEHTATSAYPNLRPTFFGARWISLPPPDEQNAIAVILSNIDAEIATLQAKLVKSHQIRQGMAQQLLTGRIRLV